MDAETLAVINDVKKMLTESSSSKGISASKKANASPYLSNQNKSSSMSEKHEKKRKRDIIKRRESDKIFFEKKEDVNKDDIHIRSRLMPYMDSFVMIQENIKSENEELVTSLVDNTTEINSNSVRTDSLLLKRIQNRFPRLCGKLGITETDIGQAGRRSDIWMIKFMEDCYDEAYGATKASISSQRKKKRAVGMDLGGLDAFPLIIQRILGRMYSVMEIRKKVCVEILLSLDLLIRRSEESAVALSTEKSELSEASDLLSSILNDPESSVRMNGHRAQIYAKFLSEEFDLVYLAIYLNARESIQRYFGIRFRDLIQPMQWNKPSNSAIASIVRNSQFGRFDDNTIGFAWPSSDNQNSSNAFESVEAQHFQVIDENTSQPFKASQVELPKRMIFISDFSICDIPMLAFDSGLLFSILTHIFPEYSSLGKLYLKYKVLSSLSPFIKEYCDILHGLLHIDRSYGGKIERLLSEIEKIMDSLNNSMTSLSSPSIQGTDSSDLNITEASIGVPIKGGNYIPIDLLLYVLCLEWKNVPPEAKKSFGNQGNALDSLRSLNDLYENNFEAMHRIQTDIREMKTLIGQVNARILVLDKKNRRLDRKWKNNQISPDELLEWQDIKSQITNEATEKTTLETKLNYFVSKEAKLNNEVESLWQAATLEEEPSSSTNAVEGKSKSSKKKGTQLISKNGGDKVPEWRLETGRLLGAAMQWNQESDASFVTIRDKLIQQRERLQKEREQAALAKEEREKLEREQELQRLEEERKLKSAQRKQRIADQKARAEKFFAESLTEIEKIEKEALELALIGESEAKSQGISSNQIPENLKAIDHHLAQKKEKIWMKIIQQDEESLMSLEEKESSRMRNEDSCSRIWNRLVLWLESVGKDYAQAFHFRAISDIVAPLLATDLPFGFDSKQVYMQAIGLVVVDFHLKSTLKRVESWVDQFLKIDDHCSLEGAAMEKGFKKFIEEDLTSRYNEVLLIEVIQEYVNNWKRQYVDWHRGVVRNFSVSLVKDLFGIASKSILERKLIEHEVNLKTLSALSSKVVLNRCMDWLINDVIGIIMKENESTDRIVESVTSNVFMNIFDSITSECLMEYASQYILPWLPLDAMESSWLPEELLRSIAEKSELTKRQNTWRIVKSFFFSISLNQRVNRHIARWKNMRQREAFENWKLERIRLWKMKLAACKIQRKIRFFLERKSRRVYQAYLMKLWNHAVEFSTNCYKKKRIDFLNELKYRRSIQVRFRKVEEMIYDRRVFQSYLRWSLLYSQYMEKKNAFRSLQLKKIKILERFARHCLWKRFFRKRRCQRQIISWCRSILAKKKLKSMRHIVRVHVECTTRVAMKASYLRILEHYRQWRKLFHAKMKIKTMILAFSSCRERPRFLLWKKKSLVEYQRRLYAAIKMQAFFRKMIVFRYVLNYAKWKRGLVRFQAQIRAASVRSWALYDLYYYRKAKLIQRVFRGYLVRDRLLDRKYQDAYRAAAYNNYDRLKYYLEKFPDILNLAVDPQGNTLLHAASAAGARRTLKLLLRWPGGSDFCNVLNYQGYSPLHLTIMSSAVHRDDTFLYMIDRGFDEDQLTPDRKTPLLLACSLGRVVIARELLRRGHDPTLKDTDGLTCLQTACSQGLVTLVADLLEHGVDVNCPGYAGTFPLHDVIASASIEIANMLISHGAYVDLVEPSAKQSPLMWACQAGVVDIVSLYLLQGANVTARDFNRRTAAHFAAYSDSSDIFHALRQADADFECIDVDGNTPLHLAAELGSCSYLGSLLEAGVNPSVQNLQGNQPSHIAARFNQVEALRLLANYDNHIGRRNFSHETPLGVAKFFCAVECQELLEHLFRQVEIDGGRNTKGEIWWDRPLEESLQGWTVDVGSRNERRYINDITGEIRDFPPSLPLSEVKEALLGNELPLRRTIHMVTEGSSLNRHDYLIEYSEEDKEISVMAREYRAIVLIQAFIRRKCAYLERRRLKNIKNKKAVLAKFIRRKLPFFLRFRKRMMHVRATRIQATWRGYHLRLIFNYQLRPILNKQLRKRRLAESMQRLWRSYAKRKAKYFATLKSNIPRSSEEWQKLIDRVRYPPRIVGGYEEYRYPCSFVIYFYRHKTTGVCTFDKPEKMKKLDDISRLEAYERIAFGATRRQINLATKLQALWRGYYVRNYYRSLERALAISMEAESKYLKEPQNDTNLFHYAIHVHSFLLDLNRARRLYLELIRRMEWRGPDQPHILYAYAIFAFVTHDQDFSDVLMLLFRARRAEEAIRVDQSRALVAKSARQGTPVSPSRNSAGGKDNHEHSYRMGKMFELVDTGFFKHAATTLANAPAWHNYAACRFLVYQDFPVSFDSFLHAFRYDPADEKLRRNFDLMMEYFHGTDKDHLAEIVRQRLRKVSEEEEARENMRTMRRLEAAERSVAAKKIQQWYKGRKARIGFEKFLSYVKELRKKALGIASRSASRSSSRSSTRNNSRQVTNR